MHLYWQLEKRVKQIHVIQVQEDICVVDYDIHASIPILTVRELHR